MTKYHHRVFGDRHLQRIEEIMRAQQNGPAQNVARPLTGLPARAVAPRLKGDTLSRSLVGPAGLLLAAGAGCRMGRPKALVELDGEPLVTRALRTLVEGGAAPVVVVLGARADDVRAVLPEGVHAVKAPDWADGMGASLRAGLAALADDADAALVHLVDLPGVTAAAVARLAAQAHHDVLARAAYGGRPGHPVLLGRAHWAGVRAAAVGDAGARGYLAGRADVVLVECGDLAAPDDVDTPEQLAAFRDRSAG